MNNNFQYLLPKVLIFLIIKIHLANSEGFYGPCNASFSCGSISGFQYPFRRHQDPVQCGYPGLELNCDQPNIATINITNINYRVLGMDPMTQIIKLVRGDMIDSVCPQNLVNTTIDRELFDYTSSYTNITFLFECPIPFDFGGIMDSLLCGISEASRVFLYPGATGPGMCRTSVIVPFPVAFTVSMGLVRTFQDGFEVRWKLESGPCTDCIQSGGLCVYDATRAPTSCSDVNNKTNVSLSPPSSGSDGAIQKSKRKWKLVTGVLCGITGIVFLLFVIVYYVRKLWKTKKEANEIEISVRNNGTLSPKRYKYSEIKKMTNSFLEKLGQGGYGSVYKGQLPDGRLVAVKILAGAKGYGEDFVNEVASISKASHVNIVTLLGFCIDGKKRALLYEFMPNGSLDKFVHSDGSHLDWNTLFLIAKGIARGLEYLHRGCNTRIVHFDIKPHNILLDEEFVPKISDFGMAKLCKKKESIVSVMGVRGTPGYIAPEVFFRTLGGVSHKSDVYSYGMMVLEMTGAHKHNNCSSTSTSKTNFPDWIYKQVNDEEEEELARKMMIVSLWCIQSDPSHRPSIDKVVEMLEGSFESLQVPTRRFESSSTRLFRDFSPSNSQTIIQL